MAIIHNNMWENGDKIGKFSQICKLYKPDITYKIFFNQPAAIFIYSLQTEKPIIEISRDFNFFLFFKKNLFWRLKPSNYYFFDFLNFFEFLLFLFLAKWNGELTNS
jgi:hypothetical protein